MKAKWVLDGVCLTEDAVLQKFAEMSRPIGLVVFGADTELKEELYRKLATRLPDPILGHMGYCSKLYRADTVYVEIIHLPQDAERAVLILMSGDASIDHAKRHQVVTVLQDLHMATVVGVYANCPVLEAPSFLQSMQTSKLAENPPTADGLDHFLMVTNEEG